MPSAETLRKLLELCGYSLTVAYGSREGLDAAQRTRPDVVLCDIGRRTAQDALGGDSAVIITRRKWQGPCDSKGVPWIASFA
jgi:CheY-like chemotaxis protein